MSVFEIIMLVCFGSAWPVSILKSYRSRTNKGKSPVFLVIVFLGYVSGIIHKILFSRDWVIGLYILNACLVATDLVLYYRNYRLDRLAETSR